MRNQSVRIKDFRTLKDVTIPFDSVTIFIGLNGAGKSTVLRELDFPPEQLGDRVATLSDHLESYLESNWTQWDESYVVIEATAGMQLPKNQYAYRTATREAKGTVPEMLKQILAKAGGA